MWAMERINRFPTAFLYRKRLINKVNTGRSVRRRARLDFNAILGVYVTIFCRQSVILIPQFDSAGLLPAADYEVSFDELRASALVIGPNELREHSAWDTPWRTQVVNNLEILTRQL